jgi:hypothetical protein
LRAKAKRITPNGWMENKAGSVAAGLEGLKEVGPNRPWLKAKKMRKKLLTWRNKSEILGPFRGGLCLQSVRQFLPLRLRTFLPGAALNLPQLYSFLYALLYQANGPRSLPRSLARAAAFWIRGKRIALRQPRRITETQHSAMCRISSRLLFMLCQT